MGIPKLSVGAYVTDGVRLLRVIDTAPDLVTVENASNEQIVSLQPRGLEGWRVVTPEED
jgi:hypothetical protein